MQARGVQLGYAIAPGLDIKWGDADDVAMLHAKLRQVKTLGIRHLWFLMDDLPPSDTLTPADAARLQVCFYGSRA